MAPPIDTRLGPGTLKIGAPLVDYGAQISNVTLEPSQDSADGTPTLGDPDPLPEITESWVLSGEAVQDFEAEAGFVNWCMDNALSVQAFEFVPNSDAGTKYTGNCLVTSIPIGGDVSAQITSSFEFAVEGTPVRVAGVGAEETPSREVAAARARRRSSIAPVTVGGKSAAKRKD
jgi:hypothetical protein